jgi:xanthine dehydrogenase YagR molybdenum-binding subunit
VQIGVRVGTGEVRVRRVVSAFDFGRVLNPATAQLRGGIVFGIGMALLEEGDMTGEAGAW